MLYYKSEFNTHVSQSVTWCRKVCYRNEWSGGKNQEVNINECYFYETIA